MAANPSLIELTADVVSSHVSNNSIPIGEVPRLIQEVYAALLALREPAPEPKPERTSVVSARASIKPDHLVCMECGQKQKLLKRHLLTAHGLTPSQYRAEFSLSGDYPMVAPAYSKRRSELAHSSGLGKTRPAQAKPDRARRPKLRISGKTKVTDKE